MKLLHSFLCASAILVATLFSSCGGGGGGSSSGGGGGPGGDAHISVEITDTPFDVDIISRAEISVDRVTIFHEDIDEDCDDGHDLDGDGDDDDGDGDDDDGDGDDDDGDGDDDDGDCDGQGHHHDDPIVLYQGEPITIDLLELRNGVTRLLANANLPSGEYKKMRMHVTDALLVLINGNTYTTDDNTLRLQGHGPNGFKVDVHPPFVLPQGGSIRALLDFNLAHSYKPHPHDDPLEADYYRLKAQIRAVNLNTTGTIHGTVVQDDGSGQVPVADATVYVLPPGSTNTDEAVATTATDPTGHFEVLGLEPGNYDVLARKNGEEARVDGVTVTVGSTTTIQIVLGGGGPGTAGVHGAVFEVVGGNLVPSAGATVHVLPQGETDPATAIASTTTAADGTYSIDNLPAGFVNLLARKGALANIVIDVELIGGTSVEQNITIF